MRKAPPEEISLSPDILRLIVSGEKKIAELQAQVERNEKKVAQLEKNIKILVSELISAGVINVPERRRVILRSMFDQAAIINLLKKKGIINQREFVREIKQLVGKEKKDQRPPK